MVDLKIPKHATVPKVEWGAVYRLRSRRQLPLWVRDDSGASCQLNGALVDESRARGEVRVLPAAVGVGPLAQVGRT
jgi:hypothetical protein